MNDERGPPSPSGETAPNGAPPPGAANGAGTERKLAQVGAQALGAAHDLRHLLSVIVGAAEALETDIEEAGKFGEPGAPLRHLRTIRASAARGVSLLRQVMAAAGEPALPAPLGVDAVIADMAAYLEQLWHGRVRVRLELDARTAHVRIDRTPLEQILLNLAMNARDAMLDGGTLTLRTRAPAAPRAPAGASAAPEPAGTGYVMLEVRDSGIGIAPDVLPRIFEPFFSTKRARGGSGVGLATVRDIVERASGRITVASEVGTGTAIRLYLPLAAPEQATGPTAQAAAGNRRDTPRDEDGRRGAVLLVEDDPSLRRLSVRTLSRAGWEVVDAESAEAALSLLAAARTARRPPIRALVTDLTLPGLDGAALIDRVRRLPGCHALPILVASGHGPESLAPELAATLQFLRKPYLPAELAEQVERLAVTVPA